VGDTEGKKGGVIWAETENTDTQEETEEALEALRGFARVAKKNIIIDANETDTTESRGAT
jgi:hypothetical protein